LNFACYGLVPNAVRPIQMVAYCENYLSGLLVDTYYINDIELLNGHVVKFPSAVLYELSHGRLLSVVNRKKALWLKLETE
jgi:hypothetical protein